MTREEAITHGKEQLEVFGGEHAEFIKLAIKALEEETTTKNDLAVDNQNIRLIDANALIKRLRPKHFDWWGEGEQDDFSKGNNSMLEEVIEAIEEFPSVTPARKKGKWIVLKDEYGDICEAICSCCEDNGNHKWKYCPNCGAEMEVEE